MRDRPSKLTTARHQLMMDTIAVKIAELLMVYCASERAEIRRKVQDILGCTDNDKTPAEMLDEYMKAKGKIEPRL